MTGPVADPVLAAARAAAGSGAWGDARAVLEDDVAATGRDGARAMLLAEACLHTGDPTSATHWLGTASPLLAAAGDRPALRRTVNMQGAAAFALGTLDLAADRFGAALDMARTDDDALLTARATNNLGAIDALRGNPDRAIAAYQLAIPSYQRLGSTLGLAESWHNLGISYRTRGELNAADDAERRAIEFATEAGVARLAAMAQVGRAEVSLRRGDFAWARATASRAASVFAALPNFLLEADALRVVADASDQLGAHADADAALARALELARVHGHRTQEAQALQTLAQMMARRGDQDAARRAGRDARELFSAIGSVADAEEMAEFLARLGR
jgi:tetratricopeptide (TPR) repeat protein